MPLNKKIAFFVAATCITACSTPSPVSWLVYYDKLGTYSSARTVDLNGDNIADIVMGAGGREEVYCDTAVMALDGATGKLLWSIPGHNQYVGSAIFTDINNDNIPDVFIGGRWAQLSAIDGATGNIIWSFFPERTATDGSDGGWYNFTTPQFIPDQDGDGIKDILISNGGDARAAAGDTNRPAGRLLVLNSLQGKILANVTVPDGKETYLSVVCEELNDKHITVYFGTGGETIGGHLYKTTLQDIMQGDISRAEVMATSETKGFVAAPLLIDITKDGTKDIVVNTAEGRMLAIDGATGSLLWQVYFPGTEAYTIPAPGYYTDDSTIDFFANFAIGVFPELTRSVRFMVDGKTGAVQYQDTIPAFQYASAVAVDLNNDGFDEVLVNQSALKRTQFEHKYYSYLLAFDFKNHTQFAIGDTLPATNFASTPWIGDLDNDNYFDIIYSAVQYHDVQFSLERPLGLYISRFKTTIPVTQSPKWGAFMGSAYTGVY